MLMMAWMNDETLRQTLETGRTVFWSRSRQEYWRKGETSGDRQFVREAYYDCDGDTLLFVVEQEGKGACHTGEYSCFFRALRRRRVHRQPRRPVGRPDRRVARADPTRRTSSARSPARLTRVVPGVARAAGRPDHAGRRLRPPRAATTSPASCSSRSSTASAGAAGRSSAAAPLATLVARDGAGRRRPATCPTAIRLDEGILAAVEALLARYRSPQLAELPPLHGGLVGYLGYDVVREVEHLPDVPPDDHGYPDAVLSVIGELAAFDHFRQRVTLIANVVRARRTPTAADLDRRLRRGRRPPRPARHRRRLAARRAAGRAARPRRPAARRHVAHRRRPTTRRRSRRPRSTSSPATSSRWCCRSASTSTLDADPFDVYRVLRQVNPSPYMYFVRIPEVTLVGLVARADGAAARRPGHLPAHRRHPPPRAAPTRRTAASAPSCASTRRSSPST